MVKNDKTAGVKSKGETRALLMVDARLKIEYAKLSYPLASISSF